MKKLTIGISSFLAGALLMTGVSSFASNGLQKIAANINNTIFLKLNGEKVNTEYPIITYDGRTYVYLKEVGNLVGASVEWNNDERSVEIVTEPSTNFEAEALIDVTWYNGKEISKKLFEKFDTYMLSVEQGVSVIRYNNQEIRLIENVTCFYDRASDTTFFSESVVNQLFDKDLNETLKQYHVDAKGNIQKLN
jgi:hypothetical protein